MYWIHAENKTLNIEPNVRNIPSTLRTRYTNYLFEIPIEVNGISILIFLTVPNGDLIFSENPLSGMMLTLVNTMNN